MLLPLSIYVVLKVPAIKNKAKRKKYTRGNMLVTEEKTPAVCRWHGCLSRNCRRATEKLLTLKMLVN